MLKGIAKVPIKLQQKIGTIDNAHRVKGPCVIHCSRNLRVVNVSKSDDRFLNAQKVQL